MVRRVHKRKRRTKRRRLSGIYDGPPPPGADAAVWYMFHKSRERTLRKKRRRSLHSRRKKRRNRAGPDRHSGTRASSSPFGVVPANIFDEQSPQIHYFQNVAQKAKAAIRAICSR